MLEVLPAHPFSVTPGWEAEWCHTPRFDDLIKRRAEFTISVMEQILAVFQETPCFQGHVPGDLFHPLLIRMSSHPRQADLATVQMNEEQYIVSDQSLESDNFKGEEIRSSENIQMSTNEVFPARHLLSLGSGGCRGELGYYPPFGLTACVQD